MAEPKLINTERLETYQKAINRYLHQNGAPSPSKQSDFMKKFSTFEFENGQRYWRSTARLSDETGKRGLCSCGEVSPSELSESCCTCCCSCEDDNGHRSAKKPPRPTKQSIQFSYVKPQPRAKNPPPKDVWPDLCKFEQFFIDPEKQALKYKTKAKLAESKKPDASKPPIKLSLKPKETKKSIAMRLMQEQKKEVLDRSHYFLKNVSKWTLKRIEAEASALFSFYHDNHIRIDDLPERMQSLIREELNKARWNGGKQEEVVLKENCGRSKGSDTSSVRHRVVPRWGRPRRRKENDLLTRKDEGYLLREEPTYPSSLGASDEDEVWFGKTRVFAKIVENDVSLPGIVGAGGKDAKPVVKSDEVLKTAKPQPQNSAEQYKDDFESLSEKSEPVPPAPVVKASVEKVKTVSSKAARSKPEMISTKTTVQTSNIDEASQCASTFLPDASEFFARLSKIEYLLRLAEGDFSRIETEEEFTFPSEDSFVSRDEINSGSDSSDSEFTLPKRYAKVKDKKKFSDLSMSESFTIENKFDQVSPFSTVRNPAMDEQRSKPYGNESLDDVIQRYSAKMEKKEQRDVVKQRNTTTAYVEEAVEEIVQKAFDAEMRKLV